MSCLTVAEADTFLSTNPEWSVLSDEVKQSHLLSAALWMNFTFEWIGCLVDCEPTTELKPSGYPMTFPVIYGAAEVIEKIKAQWPRKSCCSDCDLVNENTGCVVEADKIPYEIRLGQARAALQSVSTSLFIKPTSSSGQGVPTRETIKAGSVEVTTEWADVERGSGGEILIPEVEAIVMGYGSKRGTTTGRMPLFF